MKIESEELKYFFQEIWEDNGQEISIYKLMGYIEEFEMRELKKFEVELERDIEGLKFKFKIGGTPYTYTAAQGYIENTILNLPTGDHVIKEIFPQMFQEVIVQLFCKQEKWFNMNEMYNEVNEWFEQSLSVLTVPKCEEI